MNRIVKEGDLFKPMKEQLRQLPWMLILILALIQLTRPILSTAGFFDNFRPQGPIIATALQRFAVQLARMASRPNSTYLKQPHNRSSMHARRMGQYHRKPL